VDINVNQHIELLFKDLQQQKTSLWCQLAEQNPKERTESKEKRGKLKRASWELAFYHHRQLDTIAHSTKLEKGQFHRNTLSKTLTGLMHTLSSLRQVQDTLNQWQHLPAFFLDSYRSDGLERERLPNLHLVSDGWKDMLRQKEVPATPTRCLPISSQSQSCDH